MTLEELRSSRRTEILALAAIYGASNVRVYGSVARNEAKRGSDIDFLMDLTEDRSLVDLGSLLIGLRELPGASVEVSTQRMLRPEVREWAWRDAVA